MLPELLPTSGSIVVCVAGCAAVGVLLVRRDPPIGAHVQPGLAITADVASTAHPLLPLRHASRRALAAEAVGPSMTHKTPRRLSTSPSWSMPLFSGLAGTFFGGALVRMWTQHVANRRRAADVSLLSIACDSSRRRFLHFAVAAPLVLARAAGAEPDAGVTGGTKVYFDVALNGEPAGRIVVETFPDVVVGAPRFVDLANNKQGIGYRRSKVDAIAPGYIRIAELPELVYSDVGASPITGGATSVALERSMTTSPTRPHSAAGLVSLVVRSAAPRPVAAKVVAKNGQLVVVQSEVGPAPPNGSAFCITTGPAPELDATNLVVGQVLEGMELVTRLGQLRAVADKSGSPFFIAAKTLGDKRATVAEKGFGRPYAKVVITQSGLLP